MTIRRALIGTETLSLPNFKRSRATQTRPKTGQLRDREFWIAFGKLGSSDYAVPGARIAGYPRSCRWYESHRAQLGVQFVCASIDPWAVENLLQFTV